MPSPSTFYRSHCGSWVASLFLAASIPVRAHAGAPTPSTPRAVSTATALNPLAPLKGSYNGLFAVGSGEQDSSGFFTLTVTASGRYSGSLKRGSASYALTGQFNLAGEATQVVQRPRTHPWFLTMQLDFGLPQLHGSLSNGVSGGWVAHLEADRKVFDARANPATNYAGKYTLVIPGGTDENGSVWLGDGYMSLQVDAGGNVTYSGSLADGTTIGPVTVPVSADGWVPVYVPLYRGNGSLWSWVGLDGGQPALVVGGRLTWIKPAGSTIYPAGLNQAIVPHGTRFTPPASGGRVLALTNGVVIFEGGKLTEPLVNEVRLTSNNRFTDVTRTNKLTFILYPFGGLAAGAFLGYVTEPGSARTTPFKGVLVQGENAGYGYLLETTRSGQVRVLPPP